MGTTSSLNSVLQQFPNQQFDSLGEGHRFSLSRKYLSYEEGLWKIVYLNIFQRALRVLFGLYQSTHLNFVIKQINQENITLPQAFINRINKIWQGAYPHVNCPLNQFSIVVTPAPQIPKQDKPPIYEPDATPIPVAVKPLKAAILATAPQAVEMTPVVVVPQPVPQLTFEIIKEQLRLNPNTDTISIPNFGTYPREMLNLIISCKHRFNEFDLEEATRLNRPYYFDRFNEVDLLGSVVLQLKDKTIVVDGITAVAFSFVCKIFLTFATDRLRMNDPDPIFVLSNWTEEEWKLLVDALFISNKEIPQDKFLKLMNLCKRFFISPKNEKVFYKKITKHLPNCNAFKESILILEGLHWIATAIAAEVFFKEEFEKYCENIFKNGDSRSFITFIVTLEKYPSLKTVFDDYINSVFYTVDSNTRSYDNLMILLHTKEGENLLDFMEKFNPRGYEEVMKKLSINQLTIIVNRLLELTTPELTERVEALKKKMNRGCNISGEIEKMRLILQLSISKIIKKPVVPVAEALPNK